MGCRRAAPMQRANAMTLARRRFLQLAAGAAALPVRLAKAQSYPTRPVRIIIGFGPGASGDISARVLAQALTQRLGQQFIVENRSGAGSNIATNFVAHAPNDGYTLLQGTVANTINPVITPNLGFDFVKDFAPISLFSTLPNIVVVHPSLGVRTVQELIKLAREKPGQLSFGSAGVGGTSHFTGELFNVMAGTNLVHVPYPGTAQAATDLLSGRVQVMFSPASTVLQFVAEGKLVALASSTLRRASVAPDLPTISEAGLPGFDTAGWFGLLAPAGTAREIIEHLAAASNEAAKSPDVVATLARQGFDMAGCSTTAARLRNPHRPNAVYWCERPIERPRPAVNPVGAKPLIALTGATGFIGQCLLRDLPKRGYRLRVLLRRPSAVVGDLARPQNMAAALADADAVIHSAGVAHAMSGLPEDDYRVLNTEATIALARAAQRAGVKRFIFLSSIRAQAGPTADRVLTEDLAPQPTEAYGRSKLAAEQGLAALDLDWVALRLVLVYGAGVKGNMAELLRFARAPYPLPLGALRGRRSLLALDNLVAAIDTVLAAPGRLRRPLLVADPAALTIPEMITAMRRGLGRSPGLIPVPPPLLKTALRAAGRTEIYQRLAGSLVADPAALLRLGWTPPVTTPDALAALARS